MSAAKVLPLLSHPDTGKPDPLFEKSEESKPKLKRVPAGATQAWLSTDEAAAYLRTSPGEIRNKVYRGQLTPYKPFGRLLFKRSDLDRLVESSRKGG